MNSEAIPSQRWAPRRCIASHQKDGLKPYREADHKNARRARGGLGSRR